MMKSNSTIAAICIAALMAVVTLCSGQEYSKTERNRNLAFTNESKVARVKIQVTSEYNFMEIQIISEFAQGDAVIEILDPSGEVRGKYTIAAGGEIEAGDNTRISSSVSGEMERYYRDPAKGDWQVRITPKKATGNTFIRTSLLYHPEMDMLENEELKKSTGIGN